MYFCDLEARNIGDSELRQGEEIRTRSANWEPKEAARMLRLQLTASLRSSS
jgi:hypothetical protein